MHLQRWSSEKKSKTKARNWPGHAGQWQCDVKTWHNGPRATSCSQLCSWMCYQVPTTTTKCHRQKHQTLLNIHVYVHCSDTVAYRHFLTNEQSGSCKSCKQEAQHVMDGRTMARQTSCDSLVCAMHMSRSKNYRALWGCLPLPTQVHVTLETFFLSTKNDPGFESTWFHPAPGVRQIALKM